MTTKRWSKSAVKMTEQAAKELGVAVRLEPDGVIAVSPMSEAAATLLDGRRQPQQEWESNEDILGRLE